MAATVMSHVPMPAPDEDDVAIGSSCLQSCARHRDCRESRRRDDRQGREADRKQASHRCSSIGRPPFAASNKMFLGAKEFPGEFLGARFGVKYAKAAAMSARRSGCRKVIEPIVAQVPKLSFSSKRTSSETDPEETPAARAEN